jgi:ATPase subunit of ABC transporter with duplicated ATPase domains
VVDEASDEQSPLHSHFEWDDSEASRQYRIWQARTLIRVLVRMEPASNGKSVPCRVFVSLTPDREQEGGGYRVTNAVMADEDMRRQLLLDARREMTTFRNKYARLSELAEVFKAMESVDVDEAVSA